MVATSTKKQTIKKSNDRWTEFVAKTTQNYANRPYTQRLKDMENVAKASAEAQAVTQEVDDDDD